MEGEMLNKRGGAVESAGTRGNRQQDSRERNNSGFLCNRSSWTASLFCLSLHPPQSHTDTIHSTFCDNIHRLKVVV